MMPYKLAIEKQYLRCGNKKSRQELENMKNKILYFYLFDWLELQSAKNRKKKPKGPFPIKFIRVNDPSLYLEFFLFFFI